MSVSVSSTPILNLDQLRVLFNDRDRIVENLSSILLSMADPEEENRAWAADCLELVDSISSTKAAEIAPLCQHSGEFVVYWTLITLGKLGDVSAYQEQLTQALRTSTSVTVRQAAAQVLRLAQNASPATKDALKEASASPDPRLSRLAKQALAEIA